MEKIIIHGDDRVEIDLNNVSHCIHSLNIEGDAVVAELDILDTPAGNIINKLIDYGSKIGVSSRGAGAVNSDGTVDPDSYQFFTFDLVCRPSVAAARPEIVESEKKETAKVLTESEIATILDNYKNIDKKIKETKDTNYIIYITEGETKKVKSDIINKLIKESEKLDEGTDLKRIARYNEFDNGYVLFDYKKMTDEEAEQKAKEASEKDPYDVYYVKYDDVMNPRSDLSWINGISYNIDEYNFTRSKEKDENGKYPMIAEKDRSL